MASERQPLQPPEKSPLSYLGQRREARKLPLAMQRITSRRFKKNSSAVERALRNKNYTKRIRAVQRQHIFQLAAFWNHSVHGKPSCMGSVCSAKAGDFPDIFVGRILGILTVQQPDPTTYLPSPASGATAAGQVGAA